jgi:hypothetical protein
VLLFKAGYSLVERQARHLGGGGFHVEDINRVKVMVRYQVSKFTLTTFAQKGVRVPLLFAEKRRAKGVPLIGERESVFTLSISHFLEDAYHATVRPAQ